MALTDAALRALKANGKIQKVADGGGLYVEISPKGSRLWRVAYRWQGKQRLHAIGPYPQTGLSEARRQRDALKGLLAAGIDPAQQKRLDALAKQEANANTFGLIADELVAKKTKEGAALRTLEKVRWLLDIARPALGARPIGDISSAEVLAALRPLEAAGKHETAKRLRGLIGEVFRYAIATGRALNDPTPALRGALTVQPVRHHAAITDAKGFGGLLRAIGDFEGQPTTKAALRLMALLFPRPGELRQAEWSEFDLDTGIWTIPAARMKMRKPHLVPLPRQAVFILRELHVITGGGRLIFPGYGKSAERGKPITQRPLCENTLNGALRRLGFGAEEMTSHGFRASASTLLNESGRFSPDAIERALAHQDGDAVRRAYARGAFWNERVEMAQWWADECDHMRDGGKVMPLARKAS